MVCAFGEIDVMKEFIVSVLVIGLSCAICRSAESPGKQLVPMKTNDTAVQVRLVGKDGKPTELQTVNRVVKTDEEWARQLTREQYEIARGKGTERAFCGIFYDHKKPGLYTCVCCDLPLFSSDAKFDSGTGWPSFFQPFAKENVVIKQDLSYGMIRSEILCARCDGHLGHVFDDGPKPTGLRFCLNSASLVFHPEKDKPTAGKN